MPELDENLELQLVPWKGTVKSPLEKPIPYELITVLVERLVTQRHQRLVRVMRQHSSQNELSN